MHGLLDKIRRGEALPLPLALALEALTPVQRLGMWRRLRARRVRVDARVISFGNLTAGGTGKTPAVIARAADEVAAGRRVAVLTRGYGSMRTPEPLVVNAAFDTGNRAPLYRLVGDEAALVLRRVPEVTIVKARDRIAGAHAGIAAGADTLVLDDAFQAVQLERDENVLLIDAANPFGNRRLLPRGVLREPVAAAARATHIVLTRCDQAQGLEALAAELALLCPGVPVRRTRHAAAGLWRVADGEEMALERLAGAEISAACAIARPEAFFATLQDVGARVIEEKAFRDHAELPAAALASEHLVVVTEKDAVRMAHAPLNVVALRIELADMPAPSVKA